MGHRQRAERYMRAIDEGAAARIAGKALAECPYRASDWGLGRWWKLGWTRQDLAEGKVAK